MHIIRKLFCVFLLIALLAGCAGRDGRWSGDYSDTPITSPSQLLYGSFDMGLYGSPDDAHRIAVLLPTSGPYAEIGKSIRVGVESAVLQYAPRGAHINFFDTASGDIARTIESALASNPEIIVGPVFAEDAKVLRDMKPSYLPALSFTSDRTAVGDGIISMSLMPTNAVESTVQSMAGNSAKHFIIIAPNDVSGQTMTAAAKAMCAQYNLENIGIFYYNPHDTESIKSVSMAASLYMPRNKASTRAKEILSALLTNEYLSPEEGKSIATQLEDINRTDTIGTLPYDSILFLGGPEDTKSIASFLRYYGIGAHDAMFFGTPLWQEGNITNEVSLNGAIFTELPNIPEVFSEIYQSATGHTPSRLAAIGYETTALAIGAMYSDKPVANYITSPSGYIGINGLFRLRQNGLNERALQTVKITGGKTVIIKPSAASFITPVYTFQKPTFSSVSATPIYFDGINSMDYIQIPERFLGKYRSKTYGINSTIDNAANNEMPSVTILPQQEDNTSITAENYQSVPIEQVSRTYIDSVELTE